MTLGQWTDLTVGLQIRGQTLEDAAHFTSPEADQLKPFKTKSMFSDCCDDSAVIDACKYKTQVKVLSWCRCDTCSLMRAVAPLCHWLPMRHVKWGESFVMRSRWDWTHYTAHIVATRSSDKNKKTIWLISDIHSILLDMCKCAYSQRQSNTFQRHFTRTNGPSLKILWLITHKVTHKDNS